MGVVRDGRCEGASLQTDTGRESQADPPAGVVALQNRDLDEVPCGVRHERAVPDRRFEHLGGRQQLARDDPDHANALGAARDAKGLCRHRRQVDSLADPLRDLELGEPRRRASLQNLPRLERDEIIEDQEVGLVARSDGAQVPKPVIGGGIYRRHHDRVLGADAFGDGHPHHLVDVALFDYEAGLAIVGAEHAPVAAELFDEREEIAQVARDRSLAQHHPHPEPPLLERFLVGGCLVIRSDAGGQIGVERGLMQAGCMSVYVVGESGRELGHLRLFAGDHARVVHHLGHTDRAVAAKEALDVARREGPPRRFEA